MGRNVYEQPRLLTIGWSVYSLDKVLRIGLLFVLILSALLFDEFLVKMQILLRILKLKQNWSKPLLSRGLGMK